MSLVKLTGVTKMFGASTAVHPLDLDIVEGDFLAILGPSGCGKTTLLRMIGGFEEPTAGRIEISGRDVTRLKPEHRPTNMVFQSYGLFPHMTVRQNIAYGPRLRRQSRAEVDTQVTEMLRLVHLEAFADRPVQTLSGGQQQRVALARALIMRPAVLLLDEPLAALDLKLRKAMQEELRRLHAAVGGTFVFVTHDQGEALALANRIAVMSEGRIVQQGGPRDIYAKPATRFVSTFIGDANVLPSRRIDGTVALPWGGTMQSSGTDGEVSVVIRPEDLSFAPDGAPVGTLCDVVFLGPIVAAKITLDRGGEVLVHRPANETSDLPQIGKPVSLKWDESSVSLFDEV